MNETSTLPSGGPALTIRDFARAGYLPSFQTPLRYHTTPKYRFALDSDFTIAFPGLDFGNHQFNDEKGNPWLLLYGSKITVLAPYNWDGASPKFRIGPFWIGTPDFLATRPATLIHDAGYQFRHLPCFPLTRWEIDEIFHLIMVAQGFRLAGVYSGVVKQVGGLHSTMLGGPRTGVCHEHES